MEKIITKSGGLRLKTAGKYVEEDVVIKQKLQSKTVTENNSVCVADDGYAGLSSVTVNVQSSAALNLKYSLSEPNAEEGGIWIKGTKPQKTVCASDYSVTPQTYSDGSVSLPASVYNAAVAAVGSKICVFGSASDFKNGVAVYDVESGEVQSKTVAFGTSLGGARAVTCGNLIYVACADGYLYSYDVQTDAWNKLLKWSVGTNAALFCDGNFIYAVGGTYNSYVIKDVKRYDVVSNSYESVASMPTKLTKTCAAVVGRTVYLFGGSIDSVRTNKIYKFDLDSRTVEELSCVLPIATDDLKACVCGDSVYLAGGYVNPENIYLFDCRSENDIQTLDEIFYAKQFQSSGVQIGNDLYRIGGGTSTSNAVKTIGVFKTSMPLAEGHVLVVTRADGYPVKIIEGDNEIVVKVKRVYRGNGEGNAEPCDAYYSDGSRWINVYTGDEYSV